MVYKTSSLAVWTLARTSRQNVNHSVAKMSTNLSGHFDSQMNNSRQTGLCYRKVFNYQILLNTGGNLYVYVGVFHEIVFYQWGLSRLNVRKHIMMWQVCELSLPREVGCLKLELCHHVNEWHRRTGPQMQPSVNNSQGDQPTQVVIFVSKITRPCVVWCPFSAWQLPSGSPWWWPN